MTKEKATQVLRNVPRHKLHKVQKAIYVITGVPVPPRVIRLFVRAVKRDGAASVRVLPERGNVLKAIGAEFEFDAELGYRYTAERKYYGWTAPYLAHAQAVRNGWGRVGRDGAFELVWPAKRLPRKLFEAWKGLEAYRCGVGVHVEPVEWRYSPTNPTVARITGFRGVPVLFRVTVVRKRGTRIWRAPVDARTAARVLRLVEPDARGWRVVG